MADNKRKRYTMDYDESNSSRRPGSFQNSDTKVYSKSDRKAFNQQTRSSSTGSRNYYSGNTDDLGKALERHADRSAASVSRRDARYGSSAYQTEDLAPSRRQNNATPQHTRRDEEAYQREIEEKYRQRRQNRLELARWRRAHWIVRFLIVLVLVADILILRFGVFSGGFMPVFQLLKAAKSQSAAADDTTPRVTIYEELLTVNEFSRPGTKLNAVNGIVIHYIGNPGTGAQENRDYFENLRDGSSGTYASSNYIIGLDGSVIHCVPDDEVAYASGERNNDTISIECCHPDDSGAFTQETFQSLVLLTAKLCSEHNLTTDQVLRHYDINQKPCPKYFVDDPDSWTNFLASVNQYLN